MVEEGALTAEEAAKLRRLLHRWLIRCRVALSAYNEATTRTVAAERRLGVPAVVLSAMVATSVFSTWASDPSIAVITGSLAVAAAVLTALQTFLRHEERAEQFRDAARSYGRLRRRIEHAIQFPPPGKEEARQLIGEMEEALAEAALGKPNVPQMVWDRAELKVKGRCDARGLRALRLRLRERFDFGMAVARDQPLDEDHHLYFSGLDLAEVVSLDRLRPSKPASAQTKSVAVARRRMREAAAGRRARRAPLDVRPDGDAGFSVIDGNATYAAAVQAGWKTIPVRVAPAAAVDT